jgi:hypothetical protein
MTKILTVFLTLGLFLGNVEAEVNSLSTMRGEFNFYVRKGLIVPGNGVHEFYQLADVYSRELRGSLFKPLQDGSYNEDEQPMSKKGRKNIADTLSEMFRSGYGWWGGWDYNKVANEDEQKAGLSALHTLGAVVRDEVAQGFARYASQNDIPTNLKGHYSVVSTILSFGHAMQNPLADFTRQVYGQQFNIYSGLMQRIGMPEGWTVDAEWDTLHHIRQQIYDGAGFDYSEPLPTFTGKVMTADAFDNLYAREEEIKDAADSVDPSKSDFTQDDQIAAVMFKSFKDRFQRDVYGIDWRNDNTQKLEGIELLKDDYSSPKLPRPQNAALAGLYDQIQTTLGEIINFLEGGGSSSVLWREWNDEPQGAPPPPPSPPVGGDGGFWPPPPPPADDYYAAATSMIDTESQQKLLQLAGAFEVRFEIPQAAADARAVARDGISGISDDTLQLILGYAPAHTSEETQAINAFADIVRELYSRGLAHPHAGTSVAHEGDEALHQALRQSEISASVDELKKMADPLRTQFSRLGRAGSLDQNEVPKLMYAVSELIAQGARAMTGEYWEAILSYHAALSDEASLTLQRFADIARDLYALEMGHPYGQQAARPGIPA